MASRCNAGDVKYVNRDPHRRLREGIVERRKKPLPYKGHHNHGCVDLSDREVHEKANESKRYLPKYCPAFFHPTRPSLLLNDGKQKTGCIGHCRITDTLCHLSNLRAASAVSYCRF